jgi:hypothetical protein
MDGTERRSFTASVDGTTCTRHAIVYHLTHRLREAESVTLSLDKLERHPIFAEGGAERHAKLRP